MARRSRDGEGTAPSESPLSGRFAATSPPASRWARNPGLESSRDSTPLCPAGHLPRKGGDRQFRRRHLLWRGLLEAMTLHKNCTRLRKISSDPPRCLHFGRRYRRHARARKAPLVPAPPQ
ncbi:MAG: hypothetical protein E5X67_04785 [Mesorhizobium sp.]|nr:MAG: hypothetical protein E5X67_04785 [Mesorhizobium sp.]